MFYRPVLGYRGGAALSSYQLDPSPYATAPSMSGAQETR